MSIQQCESTKTLIAHVKTLDPEARKALIAQYVHDKDDEKGTAETISTAAFNLAVCYEEGIHETGFFTRDSKKAEQHYKLAAGLKHPSAQCNLGVLYYYGRVDIPPKDAEKDIKKSKEDIKLSQLAEAVRLFELAAAQGNTAAQFNLAECYYNKKATGNYLKYYQYAAVKNHKEARKKLAALHQDGFVNPNYAHSDSATTADAARFYIEESKYDPYAKFRAAIHLLYGMGVPQDLEKGLAWLMENADFLEFLKQNTKDYVYIESYYKNGAQYYDHGYGGLRYRKIYVPSITHDYFTPILPKKLKKLATTNRDEMIKELNDYGTENYKDSGICLQNSFRSFSLAAALGSSTALYNLGWYYAHGYGVEKNLPAALKYYRLAAKQNHEYAQRRLIEFHDNGWGGIQRFADVTQQANYHSSIADEDSYAAFRLGIYHFDGRGNIAEALKLIKKNDYLKLTEIVVKNSAADIQLQAMLASTSAAPIVNIAEPFFNTPMPQDELIGDARKEAHQEARKIIANPATSSNSYDNTNAYTVLIRLISHGFTSLVHIFLRKKPDLALTDRAHGRTALHWAVVKGNYLIVRNLLALLEEQEQLDLINAQDVDGSTPLMLAASGNHLGIAKLLYQAGANLDIRDKKHETALTKATGSPKVLPFLSKLSSLPEDSKDSKKSTQSDTETTAQELIAAIKDADDSIDDEPEEGKKDRNIEFLKQFFNLKRFFDDTPIINPEHIKQLLEILTYVDHHGKSAQDYAIEQNNTYVMRQLTVLAEQLIVPKIASRIPPSVPETTESRSRKLWDLIASPLKYPPEKNVDLFSDARRKRIRQAKALIVEGVDLNFTDGRPGNILIYLILHDYSFLIHQVFDAPDEKGEAAALITKKAAGSNTTALHWAAYKGNPEVISILLNALKKIGQLDAALNDLDEQGDTPLMAAIAAKNIYAAKLLITAGTNCRLKNSKEKSAYDIAHENRLDDLIPMMDSFAKAGEPDEQEEPGAPDDVKKSGLTNKVLRSQLLINAITNGDRKKANQLLSQEFDPNYRDCHGFNVLHHAAVAGDAELISKLLKHPELDIDAVVDGYGELTTLDLAVNFNHPVVVQLLLNAGAKLTPMKNIDQLSSAVDAKISRARTEQEINIARDKAFILLQDAKKVDHNPTILQLQKQGFDPKNAPAKQKQAAPKEIKQPHLFHAAKIGDAKTMREILKTNPDLNEIDEYGYTPLHWAVQNGHTGIVNTLLENKANIEAKDSAGATPLHISILHRKLDVVRMLVRSGADINAIDKQGKKPSHYVTLLGLPKDLLVRSTSSSISSSVTTAPHSSWWGASSTTTTSTSTSAPSKQDQPFSLFSTSSVRADGTPPTPQKQVPAVVVVPSNQ